MNEQDRKLLSDTVELVGHLHAEVQELKAAPPGAWAQSVAFLIDRYVTKRNVLWTAGTLGGAYAAFHAAVNGLPV